MPWTVSDVDRFKKGLSAKQKERWVAIANSALASCQKKGGTNCEASAIRQASGTVGNNQDMEIEINKEEDITPLKLLYHKSAHHNIPI